MVQAGDASVEEILESIKKVIARDNRAGAADQRRLRETRGLDAREFDDAKLTTPRAPAISMVQPPAAEAEDVLDLGDEETYLDSHDDEGLVTDHARASMRESRAALAMMAEPRAAPRIVRSGETSLEELTRELLRPALSEWLDKNLPSMVERLVAAEIARIVGKKG